ncbi:MAG: hypothetical protein K0R82_939 [Flavipsychrobacter sp.]|jgi:hypothetical protein|nr:hypothetical protein [Flavipsychrobacter sp.]
MGRLAISVLLSILVCNVWAQKNARVRLFRAPIAGGVVLKDVEDKFNAQLYSLESPSPDNNIEKRKLYEAKKEIDRLYPHTGISPKQTASGVPQPVVLGGFVCDSSTGIPPDNDMAISKANRAVSVINSSIAVSDGDNRKITYRRTLGQFTTKVGLNTVNDYRYDPKVIYDPEKDRFICVMLNATNEYNWIVVGFSRTNDPAGAWAFYKFYGDYKSDSTWFDYPSISITNNEFFLTGNKIKNNTSWQAGFSESVIYQIRKQDGYDSLPAVTYQIWDSITYGGKPVRNLYPVKGGRNIKGPDQYFLSNRNFDVKNDTVFLARVPGAIGDRGEFEIQALKSPMAYGVPPDGRQPDTSATLATNDGRVLGAFIEGSEIQFVSTTVHPATGAAAVYHGKISNAKTSPALTARIFTVDGYDFGYPNISYAGQIYDTIHSLISFNYTGPAIHPGVGAILFDGKQLSDMVQVKTGENSIKILSGKQQRWGDYMGSQVDWNEMGTVWIEGIYGRKNNLYGSWMAKLSSPLERRETRTFPFSVPTQPLLYPNPAMQMLNVDFSHSRDEVLSFVVFNSAGQQVASILKAKCKAGKNLIRFDIGSLQSGVYFLKATNELGHQFTLQRFVKQ